MRVLVLGGTGFIGRHIVQRLLASGHNVTVFSRTPGPDTPAGATVILGDRNRLAASVTAFRDLQPDVVVDAIAYTEEQAKAAAAVFRGVAQRIIVLSSGDVYRANDILFRRTEAAPDPTPLTEDSPLRERLYPYRGASLPPVEDFNFDDYEKILVERAFTNNADLPATILRLPMVYGPGDSTGRKRRFWPYQKRMEDGRPAILLDRRTAEWRAPWGYVEDVADAVRLAVENEKAAGTTYNVSEAEFFNMRDWIARIAVAVGWQGGIIIVDQECPPPNLPRTLNTAQNLHMDSTRIRRDLGYRETVFRDEATRRTVLWDRAHPLALPDAAQFDYAAEDRILATVSRGDR